MALSAGRLRSVDDSGQPVDRRRQDPGRSPDRDDRCWRHRFLCRLPQYGQQQGVGSWHTPSGVYGRGRGPVWHLQLHLQQLLQI